MLTDAMGTFCKKIGTDLIHSVRGEVASAQVAVYAAASSTMKLHNPVVVKRGGAELRGRAQWVGFVPVRRNTPDTPDGILERKAPSLFPDPILEEDVAEIGPGEARSLWITIPIPDDQMPGSYIGRVDLDCGSKQVSCELAVVVHKARLTKKRNLHLTNWFFADKLAAYYGIEPWSDRHWEYIELVARDMAAHRQNVILTFLWDLLTVYRVDGKLKVDFSRFDRWVQLFDRYGVADLIEGVHLAGREGGRWDAEYFVLGPITIKNPDGSIAEKIENARPGSEQFCEFLDAFLPLFRQHLADKGWLGRYIQHIADEPTRANVKSWTAISDYVKRHMPETRRMDAVMSAEMTGAIDIWVPLLNQFDAEQDFYAGRQKAGEEVWFYTCLNPRGEYPNRFIDYPLLKTRLLHWINFRYGLTGYLHWGYNWWSQDPFGDVEPCQSDGSQLPPGDNAIVYPGKNGILSSMRWETLRKGVEDYELLLELGRYRPERAADLAFQAAPSPKRCVTSVEAFDAIRLHVIEELDGCQRN